VGRLSEGRLVNDNAPLIAALLHALQRPWGGFSALSASAGAKSLILDLAVR